MSAMYIAKLVVIGVVIAYVSIGLLLYLLHIREIQIRSKVAYCRARFEGQLVGCICSECVDELIATEKRSWYVANVVGTLIGGPIDIVSWPVYLGNLYFPKYPKGELPPDQPS